MSTYAGLFLHQFESQIFHLFIASPKLTQFSQLCFIFFIVVWSALISVVGDVRKVSHGGKGAAGRFMLLCFVGYLRSLYWCPALFLLYIAAVYLQFLVVDLLFTSFSSRNHWFLFCPTMSLRWSFAAQFIVCLFELSRSLIARNMMRFRLFCSYAIHAIAVEFLSFVAIATVFSCCR